MAMTKEHYEEAGRKAASSNDGLGTAPEGDSWRREAWIRGYDARVDEMTKQHRARDGTKKLTARQEHIRLLTKEINTSKIMSANRLLRIAHKIAVLQGRENLCEST